MRNRFLVWITAVLGGIACALHFSACEERLEACQPCGSVLEGSIDISGDPRLDGTFDAVKRIREFSKDAVDAYENDLQLLTSAFGLPEDTDIPDIVSAVEKQLFQVSGVTVSIHMEPATCWVDAAWTREVELSCEERSECMISNYCTENPAAPYCSGFFAGTCADNTCQGNCYHAISDGNGKCLEGCIGGCAEMNAGVCPGRCLGECGEPCSAYDLYGACSGYCGDLCTGICESDSAFNCNGQCQGLCRVSPDEEPSCDGECRGTCLNDAGLPNMPLASASGEIFGSCRGHVRPRGCDQNPECSECRDMAMSLAWSAMTCTSAKVQVGIHISDAAAEDRESLVSKAQVLETVLSRLAGDYAKLALWTDGVDVRGELLPDDLDMDVTQDTDSTVLTALEDPEYVSALGVDKDRRYFPLSYLKARIGILGSTATSGQLFNIAAIPLRCVPPALDEAKTIMEQLIPVEESDGGLVADRGCPEPAEDEVAPCLYRIVDEQALLLGLAD